MTHLALRLLILTRVCTRPLCYIHKDQVEGDIWTIPAENMKGMRDATTEFRVPLSSEALKVIEQARYLSKNDFILSATNRSHLSESSMSQYMQQTGPYPRRFHSRLRELAGRPARLVTKTMSYGRRQRRTCLLPTEHSFLSTFPIVLML